MLNAIFKFMYCIGNTTDIHQRYHTPYTAPCNGVVSHGAQFGGLQVFADHTRKSICQTNMFTIFMRRVLGLFVFTLIPQYMQVVHALDEPRLFKLREKPEDPQIKPHAGIKMVQILVSLVYIYG